MNKLIHTVMTNRGSIATEMFVCPSGLYQEQKSGSNWSQTGVAYTANNVSWNWVSSTRQIVTVLVATLDMKTPSTINQRETINTRRNTADCWVLFCKPMLSPCNNSSLARVIAERNRRICRLSYHGDILTSSCPSVRPSSVQTMGVLLCVGELTYSWRW